MKWNTICLSMALASSLVSCRMGKGDGRIETEPAVPPSIPGAVPPRMRNAQDNEAGAAARTNAVPAQLTPEDEIIFTNPDDPDATLPELSTVLESAPQRRKGPWEESESIARRRAAREGKPLLIWFTDSRNSPMCKALAQELFSNPAFNGWADEKLVRLRVDSHEQVQDDSLSLDEKETKLVDIRNYVQRLKKQYKVLGHPNLVMVHPDGSVIARYRGYRRGEADFRWGQLKQAEAAFRRIHDDWRASLEKRGYRDWSDRKGRKVFAKLTRYHDGVLTLVEPDGTKCQTKESRLSDEDRQWIEDQKKRRGL